MLQVVTNMDRGGLETMPVPVSPTVPSAYVTPSASGDPSIMETVTCVSLDGSNTSKNSSMRSIGV